MIPPTPWPDASLMPIKSGQPDTSSVHFVGARVDLQRRVQQSLMACKSRLFLCITTDLGSLRMIVLYGESNSVPCGIEIKAWRSFVVTDWKTGKVMPASLSAPQTQPFITDRIPFRFVSSSQIVFSTPSNEKPRMSLCRTNIASNFFSFFNNNGSSSSFSSAGKTS